MLYCCLCAGVESPSHAIRADADPCARSATNIMVTLADKYTYDCPVEILIYSSGVYYTLIHTVKYMHIHTQPAHARTHLALRFLYHEKQ